MGDTPKKERNKKMDITTATETVLKALEDPNVERRYRREMERLAGKLASITGVKKGAVISKSFGSSSEPAHKESSVDKILRETEWLKEKYAPSTVTLDKYRRPDVTAKAAFYRATFSGVERQEKMQQVLRAYEGLGAIPTSTADLGYGENLLPTNMSRELLTEPLEENSLRLIELTSQVRGLEERKISFEIEDADLEDITDQQTAAEIAMEGDTITYGRFKTKVTATVKDTVLHGMDDKLTDEIENSLRSALAVKEKIRAFAPASGAGAYDSAHKHMSFYAETDGVTDIVSVTGDDVIAAILNAWADLPEVFAAHATCVMRKQDYYAAIRTIANSSTDLWGKKPEDILGIKVMFNDRAVTPIVGDFRYARQNYDIGAFFETDKDGKKGEYYFILTAWSDHQIRLKSAFRLAVVS